MRWNHKRALEKLNDFYCFFTGGRRFIRKLYATEDWGIGFIDEGDVLLPNAKALLESRTVGYLERALPGFEFRGHPILSSNKVLGTL